MTSTTIIIPTFNRQILALNLAKQIRSIHKTVQIIIIEQEAVEVLSDKVLGSLNITYCDLEKANSATAKNKGIAEAKEDIIIFFDDDVEITKDTIPAHLKAYEDPQVIGVAGRVINDGESIPEKTDVITGKTNFLATKFLYQFWSTKKQEVDFVYGCNMSFRKSALKKISGFDEKFSKIFDEVDLSRRVKKIGQILFEPEALVYHHKAKSGGIRKDEEQKEDLVFRNYGYFIAKHVMFPFSIVTLVLRTITALKTHPPAVFSLLNGFFK